MATQQTIRRPNDEVLEDICFRLRVDPMIDMTTVDVAVDAGEVLLSGTVDSYATKRHAQNIVCAVRGVERVQNNLRLRKSAGVMPDLRRGKARVAS